MENKNLIRDDFFYLSPLTTRWMDNDVYGHVNNVTYYSYFDTIVNSYLIEHAGLNIQASEQIGYIVKSECSYFASIAFPQEIEGAFRVNRIGRSSVEYGVAIFKASQKEACAYGTMTHVFVDRKTEKPVEISGVLLEGLQRALMAD